MLYIRTNDMTIMNEQKEKTQPGNLYYLNSNKENIAFYCGDEINFYFYPIKGCEGYCKIDNGIMPFHLEKHLVQLDTNEFLDTMITEDIHNLWLDAPKVVQDVLEKYMEECRFDEFVALEAERVLEEQELNDLEQKRQDN